MSEVKSSPSTAAKAVALLVLGVGPIALGLWMIATRHAFDGADPSGRHYLSKLLLKWIWGYPGGIVCIGFGLLLLVANLMPRSRKGALLDAEGSATPNPPDEGGKTKSLSDEEEAAAFIAEIPANAEMHVAKSKEHFGVDLDYSEKSLTLIDEIITKGWQEPPVFLDPVAIAFGSYVGETIRKLLGGKWKFDEDAGLHLGELGGTTYKINPIAKVRKRFLNGDEDSIAYYYEVVRKLVADAQEAKYGGPAAGGNTGEVN